MANKYSQSIRSEHVWWGYKADKYNNTLLLMRLYDINNIQQIIHWKLFWLSASHNSLGEFAMHKSTRRRYWKYKLLN